MSAPSTTTDDPFTERHKASTLSRVIGLRSTRERRLVWVKGTMSKVEAPSDDRVVSEWDFDTAVFVLMSPRTIKIDLREEAIKSSDSFPLTADMALTCQPKDSTEALERIAVSYQQCVLSLAKLAESHLCEFCRNVPGKDVPQRQAELADGVLKILTNAPDALNPFHVIKVHLNLRCPTVEDAQRREGEIELQTSVDRAQAANEIAKLGAALERRKKQFEHEQYEAREKGATEAQLAKARIDYLGGLSQLCIEAKIMVAQDNPQLAALLADVEKTRLTKDLAALELAISKVQDLVRSLAEAARGGFGSGPNININKP